MQNYNGDPKEFLEDNQEVLLRVLKHSDDEFVRALILSALVEYGPDPLIEDVERDLERAVNQSKGGS
ncbi:hypothetical protein [Halobellus rufus]|uniref:hypothetical protein n=1 Tax=Halobellus rufus TaxID=1448860 RepID=UPI0009DFE1C3|nr:hypothetical protein [Halobellus rufus]